MNSVFKVSGNYREWQEDSKAQPNCVLMDVDGEIGHTCAHRELEHPSGSPIVAVGTEDTGKSIAAYIPRPFRWADVLNLGGPFTLQPIATSAQSLRNRSLWTSPPVNVLRTVQRWRGMTGSVALPRQHFRYAGPDDKPRIYKTVGAVLVVNPNPIGWRHVSAEVANLEYRVDPSQG